MSIVQLRLTRRQVQDSGASAERRRSGANGRICLAGWVVEADKPALYSLALRLEEIVREGGAMPATVGIIAGECGRTLFD